MIEVDVRIDGIAAGIAAQSDAVCKLAGGANLIESERDPWLTREQLWNADDSVSIFKLSMLPAQLSSTAEFIREALSANAEWTLLMQSTGLAWLRADAVDCAQIAEFISALRSFLAPTGGTVVLLKAPSALREED